MRSTPRCWRSATRCGRGPRGVACRPVWCRASGARNRPELGGPAGSRGNRGRRGGAGLAAAAVAWVGYALAFWGGCFGVCGVAMLMEARSEQSLQFQLGLGLGVVGWAMLMLAGTLL